jgi:hypothetical protein
MSSLGRVFYLSLASFLGSEPLCTFDNFHVEIEQFLGSKHRYLFFSMMYTVVRGLRLCEQEKDGNKDDLFARLSTHGVLGKVSSKHTAPKVVDGWVIFSGENGQLLVHCPFL